MSNNVQEIRYAIAGCGAGIAESHLAALAKIPTAKIVGMCDVSAERGQPRAEAAGVPFFTDHVAMIETTKPDVVSICTPHPFHAVIAIDAFARGAHVLTEKPMAISVAEADRMIDAADKAGRLLAVNFQQRFKPAAQRARKFIEDGELGTLVRVQVTECWFRTEAYFKTSPWRGRWRTEGGAILMNQSPHTMDLLHYFAGAPAKVWGWTRTRMHHIECEDTAQAMLEMPNGAPGYFTASTAEMLGGPRQRITIIGERGALELADNALTLTRFQPDIRTFSETSDGVWASPAFTQEQLAFESDGGGHLAVYRDLEAAMRECRRPLCDGREARGSLELANAIIYSSHTNEPVTLPLDRTAYSALLAKLQTERLEISE